MFPFLTIAKIVSVLLVLGAGLLAARPWLRLPRQGEDETPRPRPRPRVSAAAALLLFALVLLAAGRSVVVVPEGSAAVRVSPTRPCLQP